MNYMMNDTVFWVPDEWHEQTVHILSSEMPGRPGISLVAHTEIMEKKKDSTAYKDMSLDRLQAELPGFTLLKEEVHMLYGKGWLLEHRWHSDVGLMHHFQALACIDKETSFFKSLNKGYSLTMSMMESLYEPTHKKTFLAIAQSLLLK